VTPVRTGWLLAVLLAGMVMANVDIAVVNVAAPAIHAGLGASGGELQLVVSGYTLSYAVLLVTGAAWAPCAASAASFGPGLRAGGGRVGLRDGPLRPRRHGPAGVRGCVPIGGCGQTVTKRHLRQAR
jgi:MFS family permease